MKHLATTALLAAVLACPAATDELSDLCGSLIAETAAQTSPDALTAQMAAASAQHAWAISDTWGTLGAACSVARRVEPALYCFAHAAQAEPDDPMHLNNLGFILLHQERYDEAQIPLEAAYELAPGNAQLLMNLGKLRWRQGRADEAIDLLERAAEEESHPEYPYALAKVLYHSDQAVRAEQVLDENLRQHPTHEPSLELYQQIAGRQWNTGARELAEEALALAEDAQELVEAWGVEIDRIAAQSTGDTPGTQMAQFNVGVSQAMVDGLHASMENPHVTDELLAMQALQCYRTQIETIGKVYHGYYVCVYLHHRLAEKPHLQISPVGGFDFMISRCPFTEPLYQLQDAGNRAMDAADRYESPLAAWCAIARPVAQTYVTEMPARFNVVALHMARALEQVTRLDSALVERFDNFHERAEALVRMDLLKQQFQLQGENLHAFFDPDDDRMLGLGWAWQDTETTLKDVTEQHRAQITNAVHDINRCGGESSAPTQPPSFLDVMMVIAQAQQNAGASVGYKIDMVLVDFTVGADGVAQVTVGQGLQGVLYADMLTGTFGYKFGAGYSIEMPGPATGQSSGVYFRFDDTAGPGVEWSVSGSVGGVEGSIGETYWFDSQF